MSIRSSIHRAIRQGTVVYAVVEEQYRNMASVRLVGTSQRLSGLLIMGGDVSPGDVVVVDYSHGVPPIIRSNYTEENDKPQIEMDIYENYQSEESPTLSEEEYSEDLLDFDYSDMSCLVWCEPIGSGGIDIPSGVPTTMLWETNDAPGYYVYMWDTANMWPFKGSSGGTTLTAPVAGKYYVHAAMLMYGNSYGLWHPKVSGWGRLAVMNGARQLAVVTARIGRSDALNQSSTIEAHVKISCIANLAKGDTISLVVTQTYSGNENTGYIFGYYERCHMSMTLLAGTSILAEP